MDFIFLEKGREVKKRAHLPMVTLFLPTLRTSNDVRLQAVRTYMKSLGRAVNNRLHGADIGLPHFVGSSMRVAYLNAEVYSFFADIAFCHNALHLLHSTIAQAPWNSPCSKLQRLYSNRKASEMQVKNQDFGENFKKEPEKVAGSYFL